jgi:hypothetical protein
MGAGSLGDVMRMAELLALHNTSTKFGKRLYSFRVAAGDSSLRP